MVDCLLPAGSREPSIPIHAVTPDRPWPRRTLDARSLEWAGAMISRRKAGPSLPYPTLDGAIARVLFGLGGADAAESSSARLPASCPRLCRKAAIALREALPTRLERSCLGPRRLSLHPLPRRASGRRPGWSSRTASMRRAVSRIADGVYLARDLINTAANDMGPAELAAAAADLAARHGAKRERDDRRGARRGVPDDLRRRRRGDRRPGAAPGRPHLGRSGTIRR